MSPHKHNVDLESNFEDSEYGHMLDREEVQRPMGSLFEGMCFQTKEEVQHALQQYHMSKGVNYKIQLLKSIKLIGICDDDDCA